MWRNQVNKMMHSVNFSQLFPPATWLLIQIFYWIEGCAWVKYHRVPLRKVVLTVSTAQCVTNWWHRSTHIPEYGNVSLQTSQPLVARLIAWTSSRIERANICPYWNRYMFWVWVYLLWIMLLPAPPSIDLQNTWSSWQSTHPCISSGNSCPSKEV